MKKPFTTKPSKAFEIMAENVARTIDNNAREVLVFGGYGYGVDAMLPKMPFYKRWKFKISMWIIDRRVALAEWIGGNYLHRYCDD